MIYYSSKKDARLIGLEYMILIDRYNTLGAEEQKRWHPYELEVGTRMLVLGAQKSGNAAFGDEYNTLELLAMKLW